jgi:hypothetical protein
MYYITNRTEENIMEKQIHVIAQLKNGLKIRGFTYGDIEAGEWHAIFTKDSGLNFSYGKVLWVLPI